MGCTQKQIVKTIGIVQHLGLHCLPLELFVTSRKNSLGFVFRNGTSAGTVTQNSSYNLRKMTFVFRFNITTASMKSEYVSSFFR